MNKKFIFIMIISIIILVILNCISMYIQNKERNSIIINGNEFINIKDKICVYIDGAVNNPGMYKFEKDINLEKVLDLIGGIKENADIENIDLKTILKDKEKINIPYIRENIDYTENDIIDINNASIEELEKLPGIGNKMAERIIEYRKTKKFEYIEDIMNVEGIGESKFKEIKQYIIVY